MRAVSSSSKSGSGKFGVFGVLAVHSSLIGLRGSRWPRNPRQSCELQALFTTTVLPEERKIQPLHLKTERLQAPLEASVNFEHRERRQLFAACKPHHVGLSVGRCGARFAWIGSTRPERSYAADARDE